MRIQNKIMLGALIFVLCASAAYAQITVSSIPTTTVRNTGRAELAGAVRLTANANVVADVFTVRFGVPITNNVANGMSLSGNWPGPCTIAVVDNTNGIVTINCGSAAVSPQFVELDGVRVSVDGFAGSAVSAQIGTLNNPITAGQSSAVVIESLAPGLVLGTGSSGQVTLASATVPTPANAALILKEGFASAWKTVTDEGVAATQATQILLTVSGLPAGFTVTATIAPAPGTTAGLTATLSGATFTGGTGGITTRTITITGENQSVVEQLEIDFVTSFANTVTLPLTPTTYSVTATLTPNDAALTALGAVVSPFKAPKFAVSNVPSPASTILTVISGTTTMLIPYASTQSNYDTGISIANTTTDPFGAAGGTAAVQSGPITFYFYPNDGTTIASYATVAGSPGAGLNASGMLTTGSTYTVLLSQLLRAAAPTRTATFSGYIIAVVGASECHGIGFISDFAGRFTSFTPALIIPNPAVAGFARSGLTNEILGF